MKTPKPYFFDRNTIAYSQSAKFNTKNRIFARSKKRKKTSPHSTPSSPESSEFSLVPR